jgi:AcrR family transcriptional regulator
MSAPDAPRRRAGRRGGDSGTRGAILEAARRQFAELGYDRTSLRQIALEAGVDPALVTHFHGSKQQLFVSVVELPFEPAEVLPRLLTGDRDRLGERLARFVLGVLETAEGRRRVTGLVRAAASEPEAARIVRELVTRELFAPITEHLGAPDAPLRASLLGAQVVGLVMARYVVAVEPLASSDPEALVRALAPILQYVLTAPLDGGTVS